ncbi:hypothetical protein M3Y95_00888900 [Aphelenchoides besseyi]|nr:hypothetical protein M3Y95_00888900 [Aphelenchoides besseyi]
MSDIEYGEQLVVNGTADLIARPAQKTAYRLERFAFSDRLCYTYAHFVRQRTKASFSGFMSFFQTYDSWTWIAIGMAWMLQWSACVLMRRVESRMINEKSTSIGECAWQLLRVQLMQPEKIPFKTRAGKFSLTIFSLLQCIILGLYGSFILATRIGVQHREPKTLDDAIHFLQTKQYKFVTSNPNFIHGLLSMSNAYPFIQLREAIERNPLLVSRDSENTNEIVERGEALSLQFSDESKYYGAACDLIAMDKEMLKLDAFLMFRKKYPLLRQFNKAIHTNRPQIDQIVARYLTLAKRNNGCPDELVNQPLSFSPYEGLCVVSLFIMMIALCVFIAELLGKKCLKTKSF